MADLLESHGVQVNAEPIEGGGWRAIIDLPDGVDPIIGLGETFVRPDGRVVDYPSSYSTRMALEAFREELADG